jgi:hypothetical protein
MTKAPIAGAKARYIIGCLPPNLWLKIATIVSVLPSVNPQRSRTFVRIGKVVESGREPASQCGA